VSTGAWIEPDRERLVALAANYAIHGTVLNGTNNSNTERSKQIEVPDLWLLFAPIKRTPADYLVQKATELGASRIATVERGTMTKSVVATGKIEPITKVEIKSKANGIIEKMNVDVDQMVRSSDVLVELDKAWQRHFAGLHH
jgi:hypothetical protein